MIVLELIHIAPLAIPHLGSIRATVLIPRFRRTCLIWIVSRPSGLSIRSQYRSRKSFDTIYYRVQRCHAQMKSQITVIACFADSFPFEGVIRTSPVASGCGYLKSRCYGRFARTMRSESLSSGYANIAMYITAHCQKWTIHLHSLQDYLQGEYRVTFSQK